jgi:hypothetical protein
MQKFSKIFSLLIDAKELHNLPKKFSLTKDSDPLQLMA